MGLQLRLWSQSLHSQCGATIAIDASHVSQLWSSCHVCCSRGCSASGHGCGLHACGMGPRSPSMWHMCRGRGLHAVSWLQVQHIRSRSWSLHAWCGAAVTVDAAHVSWSQVQHIGLWLRVPSLRRMHCGCRLCTACGVTIALSMPCRVLLVPSLHQVWCCSCGRHATCGVCSCKRQ
jgi:hypothetical protein